MTTKKKRPNAQDATLRNIRAAKRRLDDHGRALAEDHRAISGLLRRVIALEAAAKKK